MKTYAEICESITIQMPPFLMKGTSGVYSISSKTTGKRYIGCSKDILKRIITHDTELRRGKHSNSYLQSAYNKYGSSDFQVAVITYADNVYEAEKKYIALFESNDRTNGYNLTGGGDGLYLLDEEVSRRAREKITEASRKEENRKKVGDWSRQFHSENKKLMSKVLSENATKGWVTRKERYGKRTWVTDGVASKIVQLSEVEEYLSKGWRKGRS